MDPDPLALEPERMREMGYAVIDMLVARIRQRGWNVERIGSLRTLTQPIPARTASR